MLSFADRVGEWTGFGIKKQPGHHVSFPASSGESYSNTEINLRRSAVVLGLGAVSYTAWDTASRLGLV